MQDSGTKVPKSALYVFRQMLLILLLYYHVKTKAEIYIHFNLHPTTWVR